MNHIVSDNHRELLRAILRAILAQGDPDATFVNAEDVPDPTDWGKPIA